MPKKETEERGGYRAHRALPKAQKAPAPPPARSSTEQEEGVSLEQAPQQLKAPSRNSEVSRHQQPPSFQFQEYPSGGKCFPSLMACVSNFVSISAHWAKYTRRNRTLDPDQEPGRVLPSGFYCPPNGFHSCPIGHRE